MIALARVDDRLVHGQVMVGWVPHVRASRLIVASDRLAANPLLASIVRAGGVGVPVDVLAIGEAVRRERAGEWARDVVLLLFESLQDALAALDAGLAFSTLNLGGLRHDAGQVCLCEGITLDADDCAIVREFCRRGVDIDVRLMPLERARAVPDQLR